VWQSRAEMLMEGRRDELVERYARDTIDLYKKLKFDVREKAHGIQDI